MKQIILGSLALGYLLAQENDGRLTRETSREALLEPQVLERIEMSKTGMLVGVELAGGVGIGKGKMVEQKLPLTQQTPPTGLLSNLNALALHTRLVVGFQKYFGARELLGFDIKGKVGTGYLSIKHEGHSIMRNGKFEPVGDSGIGIESAYIPYTLGLEANLLYDFWNRGEQSIGVSVGVGYDFVYGANTKLGFSNSMLQGILDPYFGSYTDKNISYSVISPKVGLHYYLGKHQFAGTLSLDKALGTSPNINFVFSRTAQGVRETLFTEPNLFFTLNLSYAYRF